jgi:hypothetical protein
VNRKSTELSVPQAETSLALVEEVLESVPGADEDPTPRMMAEIIAAESAADWEQLFKSQNLRDNHGRQVRVHAIRKAQSRFESALGVFLIADVTWLDSGEEGVLATSSAIAMAQLLNCWKRGDFPHDFEIVEKPTETAAGFKPLRLRSLGKVVG